MHNIVSLNNTHSNIKLINCGVFQGFVLGLFLFTLHIMISVVVIVIVDVFAGYTCFILQHKTRNGLNAKINEFMNNINEWMNVNKLTINFSKSNFLLINHTDFNSRKVDINWSTSFKLMIVENPEYLGVMFDKNLSFAC